MPLAPSAVRLLESLPRDDDNPWVITGRKPHGRTLRRRASRGARRPKGCRIGRTPGAGGSQNPGRGEADPGIALSCTVRSKGCLSNKTALAMVFKLAQAAQNSWRRLDGHNQLPKLIVGVKFIDGIEAVRQQPQAAA